jgi:hypothetical protein
MWVSLVGLWCHLILKFLVDLLSRWPVCWLELDTEVSHYHCIRICCSPAVVGLQLSSLVLGRQIMTQTLGYAGQQWCSLFFEEYISAVQTSRKEYVALPRFPLTSALGLAVTLLWLQAQVWNIMFLGLGLPGPTQRENRGVQQLSSWTVAISLRDVTQKLQWLCSFPRGLQDPEGFPHLPLLLFYEKGI